LGTLWFGVKARLLQTRQRACQLHVLGDCTLALFSRRDIVALGANLPRPLRRVTTLARR
jgi:hypothetical protein